MPWAAVETNVLTSPEGRRLSASAKLLWLAGRLHCGEFETNGLIERSAIPLLMYASGATDAAEDLVAELVKVEWWHDTEGGWEDVGFLRSNPSHESRERRREVDAAKKQRQRTRPVPPGRPLVLSPGAVPPGRPGGKTETGQNNTGELLSGGTARSLQPAGSHQASENGLGDRAHRKRISHGNGRDR